MAQKETGIDCMKYRKSTHLAGVDVDMIIIEKGKCILTIKEAYYEKQVLVNGRKTDGYFIQFEENVKDMMANSGNRKRITSAVQNVKGLSYSDSRNVGNWSGVKIELIYDPEVKMNNEKVGGIHVKKEPVVLKKKTISDEKFAEALIAIEAGTYTKEELAEVRELTESQKAQLK